MLVALVILFSYNLHFSVTANPAFTSTPQDPSNVVEGKNITLRWNFTLDSTLGLIKFLNVTDQIGARFGPGAVTGEGKYQSRFSGQATDTQAELTILEVKRSDQSTYKISVISSSINGIEHEMEVIVQYQSSISCICKNQTVDDGETVWLNCKADGNPIPRITWTRLFNNDTVSMPLTITGKQDEGAYRCTADNGIGNPATADVFITVQYQPNLSFISVNQTVNDGDTVWLNCRADGFPAPNITWIRLSQKRDVSMPFVIMGKQDEGVYRCIADNGIGNPATADVFVTVQFYRPFNTVFSTNLTNAGSLNETFYLMCSAEANPAAEYRLYKEDESVANIAAGSQNIGLYATSVRERINQVVYKCIPHNTFGDGPTKTINVTVQYPVGATRSGENVTVYEGGSKTLTCPVVGNPEPKIKWFKGSEASGIPLSIEQDLTVEDVWESVCFSCVASNSLGTPVSIAQCLIVVGKSVARVPSTTVPQSKSVTRVPSTTVPQKSKCSCPDSQTTLLVVIIAVLGVIIILLLVVIIWQQRKLRIIGKRGPYEVPEERNTGFHDNEIAMKDVNPTRLRTKISTQQQVPNELAYMPLQGVSPTGEGSFAPKSLAPNVEYAPLDMRTRSWEVARSDVKVEKIIGKGAFGQVAKGTGKNLPFRSGETSVAIKMVKANAAESDKRDLKSELELMKTLKPHPHVIKLLGCVTESEPLLVLIEYVPYGDLLGYLRKSRGLNDTYYKDPDIKPKSNLTSQQLMKFAWQIADGMSYLSLRKVVHRDLAARNVLVGERETCKITDFGMARDVQEENIYERKTKGRLPVKWTAYESLLYGQYTTKSDVWSYGVVLYEISTIGGSPYPRMEGRKIASLLQQGYRMPKPEHVDNNLYQIMRNCWQSEPKARPSFSDLTQQLKRMENQHKNLINMHIYDNTLYANLEDLNA